MAKVKMKYDPDNNMYKVKSKSLTAVLQRATLLVEALGEDRIADVAMYTPDASTKKYEIYVYV